MSSLLASCSASSESFPGGRIIGGGGNAGSATTTPGGGEMIPVSIPSDPEKCGNGKHDVGEDCDDGNRNDTDGCNRLCQKETGFDCPDFGKPCVSNVVCGDGVLSPSELCDDGNLNNNDGCSQDCRTIEVGFRCRGAGKACTPICGDGLVLGREGCDDKNRQADDGCSPNCLVEPGYTCEGVPSACVAAVCGNGKVETGEQCDVGPQNGRYFGNGTGCSATCAREPMCRDANGVTRACEASCGDGNVDQSEGCDDGNLINGDGCDATCQIENGFSCALNPIADAQPCAGGGNSCLYIPIVYRDFDGQQSPTGHPDFFYLGATTQGGKKTICVPNANGLPEPREGNRCNSDATELCLGLAKPLLDADGKPAANTGRAHGLTCPCKFTDWGGGANGILGGEAAATTCQSKGSEAPKEITLTTVPVIQSAESFKEWYRSNPTNEFVEKLELRELSGQPGTFQFSSSNGRTVNDDLRDIFFASDAGGRKVVKNGATSLSSGFFPDVLQTNGHPKLCNLWPYWNANASCTGKQWYSAANSGSGAELANVKGEMRNFYFTSEVRYLFRFSGNEKLAFYGDDDVWVYINGQLVLDMGAPHERLEGSVELDGAGATATLAANGQRVGDPQKVSHGMEVGKTYEIAIFHADRHPRESNYQLTLAGFKRSSSRCTPECGDGVVTIGEECDDGPANKDGKYDGCSETDCRYNAYCGDGVPNPEEQCDLGREKNVGTYGDREGCTATCKKAPYCGDGIVDSPYEPCDPAAPGAASGCSRDCQIVIP